MANILTNHNREGSKAYVIHPLIVIEAIAVIYQAASTLRHFGQNIPLSTPLVVRTLRSLDRFRGLLTFSIKSASLRLTRSLWILETTIRVDKWPLLRLHWAIMADVIG
jgi:hypothetical protein